MIAKRVDDNQAQITDDLRKVGAEVTPIHTVGKGVADLLVSYEGYWIVFEVKPDHKPKSKQKLTKDEEKWIKKQKAPVFIVHNMSEILKIIYKEIHEKTKK